MSTKNHFEHTLPPLLLANGTQLSAGLYSVEGGTRYRMVFGDHPERLSSPASRLTQRLAELRILLVCYFAVLREIPWPACR